jgi:hypothetical protein
VRDERVYLVHILGASTEFNVACALGEMHLCNRICCRMRSFVTYRF